MEQPNGGGTSCGAGEKAAAEPRTYQANRDYLYRSLAGEHILVPTGPAAREFNGLATLNESGAFLWQLLSEKRTRDELVAALAAEYELPEAQVAGDADRFLALALERGLVRCE